MSEAPAGEAPISEAAPPRVVIADDQTLVRGGFRMILGAAGIPVVAEPRPDGGWLVRARMPVEPVSRPAAAPRPAAQAATSRTTPAARPR